MGAGFGSFDPGPDGNYGMSQWTPEFLAAWQKQNQPNAVYGDPNSVATYKTGSGQVVQGGSGNSGLADRNSALEDPNSSVRNDFYYGGTQGAAQADVERYRGLAAAMQDRQGVQANYGKADAAGRAADQARNNQLDATNMYRDAANGVGPSVAQAQFAQALDASQRAQASMANSARGGGLARAAAQQQAMAGAADMNQNAAGAAATLRAQEIAQARAGYAGAASAMRGADQSQQGIYGQQAQSNAALADAQRARNDQMQVGMENLGQGVQAARQQGGQAAQNAINANNAIAAGSAAASNQLQAANNARDMQTAGAVGAVAGGVIGTAIAPGAGTAAGAAAGGAAGSAVSDQRQKQNIEAGDSNIRSFLDAISARDYEYRNPESVPGESPGRHTSVMAQDLEQTPVGRRMVEAGPDGVKRVNYNEHAATMLAAMASLNKRLAKVEGTAA